MNGTCHLNKCGVGHFDLEGLCQSLNSLVTDKDPQS